MCGIGGIYCFNGAPGVQPEKLTAMCDILRHRGPDDEGTYLSPGRSLGLAMRRLSIIDVEGGHQPISNADENICLVANGEIFNYRELTLSLKEKGYKFKTAVDVEVIIHLYEEYGLDFVEHLRGQFAIALWDEKRKRLVLARDRLGIRPLFYHIDGGKIVFGSEIKALFAAGIPREIDPGGVAHLFSLGSAQAPRTFFKNVKALPPGSLMIVDDKPRSPNRYWRLVYPKNEEREDIFTTDHWAHKLRDLLSEATRLRLRADVPVGAYLSGGIDSSCVLALLKEVHDAPITTYTLSFDDDVHDETAYANLVAEHLRLPQRVRHITYADVAAKLPQLIWHAECGLLTTESISLMLLAEWAAKEVKVVLTGEGADEIFGGYLPYRLQRVLGFAEKDPTGLAEKFLKRKLTTEEQLALWPPSDEKRNIIERFGFVPAQLIFQRLLWLDGANLFSDDFTSALGGADPLDEISISRQDTEQRDRLDQSLYFSINTSLHNYILAAHGDRAAMANSLEARYPFLDHPFVEFAATIPPRLKMRGVNEKYILRKAFAADLPELILKRKKKPLTTPIARALLGKNRPDYVDDLLNEDAIRSTGFFDWSEVLKLRKSIEDSLKKKLTPRETLWQSKLLAVLSVQLCHRQFITDWPQS